MRAAGPGWHVTVDVTGTVREIVIGISDDGPGLGHVPTDNSLGQPITHPRAGLRLRWRVRAQTGHRRRRGRADRAARAEIQAGALMRLLLCDDHRLLLEALSMALADKGTRSSRQPWIRTRWWKPPASTGRTCACST
jgi:hypothetical protein